MLKKDDSSIIKRILKKEKLTQNQLADKFNVSKQYLSQIVNNQKPISPNIIDKIKTYYPGYIKEIKKLKLPNNIDINFIEKFRNHYGYSLRKLSSLLDISPSLYSLILKGERNLTDNIIEGIRFLNENPDKQFKIHKKPKKTSVELKHFVNLFDYKSENHVLIDKTLLGNRNYHQCILTDLKIDSSHVWLNVYKKAIIDISSKELQDNKQYLVKYDGHLCFACFNNTKIECIALDKSYNTLIDDTPKPEEIYGEIIGLLQ